MQQQTINKENLTLLIRKKAIEVGFFACGIAPVRYLDAEKKYLDVWIGEKNNAEMKFLEHNADVRSDPRKLLEGVRSVISLMFNYNTWYFPEQEELRISKYAYIQDYHKLIKNKLQELIRFIKETAREGEANAFVDSAPVFEKSWAQSAGLGWRGKHTILVSRTAGSFFFLGEIITSLELKYNEPESDHCGSCTKCIDACPTGALKEPYLLDAGKCIAYLTVENKGEFHRENLADFKKFIFGCDICQDVCPYNDNTPVNLELISGINKILLNKTAEEWLNLTEAEFNDLTKNSCIKRTGLAGMKRNIRHVIKKN